jgi:hypothetical protein
MAILRYGKQAIGHWSFTIGNITILPFLFISGCWLFDLTIVQENQYEIYHQRTKQFPVSG